MKSFEFTKMVASGNDFIVIKEPLKLPVSLKEFTKKVCDRKFGIGADGLLVVEKSRSADAKMRIFNADGSEAEMCGNGARCFAYFLAALRKPHAANLKFETKAGIINAEVNKESVKIKLTEPHSLKFNISILINGRRMKVNLINTGVPHTVVFVDGLENIDVFGLGKQIRRHKQFFPAGTNVNFVEVSGNNSIKIRTYERGVEDETLACGTGSVASALITSCLVASCGKINVHTQGGEVLKVYFDKVDNKFNNIWLEGTASIVYKGEYYV